MRGTRLRRATGILLIAGLAACGDNVSDPIDEADPPDEANDRLTITNDSEALSARVVHPNSGVAIDHRWSPFDDAMAFAAQAPTLTLIAEILPPTVDGEIVQATSVSIESDDRAMVSYNMRGAPRLGGIDWMTRLTSSPRISASVTFNDSDVSAVAWDGKYVYAAEATNAPEFEFPAVFERVRLKNDKFTLQDNVRVGLSSYAATSALRAKHEIYATSGDGGHVFAFDKNHLTPLGQYPLEDARWVAWDEDGDRIVVVQGTPGRISVFAESQFPGGAMNLLGTFPFPGADVPESKSTAAIAGGKAFIAAGPDGVQIVCLDDGQIVGSVPRPDPASLGLDPSVVVTNAVTVEKDLMFISNGEAGVWIARGSKQFDKTDCDEPQQIGVIGQLRFDDLQSVNHVELDGDILIIAAGLGGVKVVEVSGL